MIPIIKLTSSFKRSLQLLIKDPGFEGNTERHIRAVASNGGSLELVLHDFQYFSRGIKGEHLVRFVNSNSIHREDHENSLKSIMQKIDSYGEYECLDSYSLCVPFAHLYSSSDTLVLKFGLFFPDITFKFQPITPLKLVSTALSISLTRKESFSYKFQSGYLTLDQKRRVLPLKVTDSHIMQYPLVGVWATGVRGEITASDQVWASCIRFIESQLIQERISPSPETNSFLFVYFSPRPVFYEVSTVDKPSWKITSKSLKPNSNEIQFLDTETPAFRINNRERKSLTASTSSSEGRHSRIKPSFNTDSTEKMIIQQNIMLKTLEKQITELQHALSEPKLVNAGTNTTSYFQNSQTGFGTGRDRRQSLATDESMEFISRSNPLRSSCNIASVGLNSDSTITVPRIIYKSDSDSCEEEVSCELVNIA